MDIGILGAGHIGATVGNLWVQAGHRVRFTARELDTLGPLVEELGPNASAGDAADTIAFGQAVLVALPARAVADVLAGSAPLGGKIAIHAANAFARGGAGGLPLTALTEQFPAARWVRAYNTLQARVLAEDHHRAERFALLLSGDDEHAKATVAGLIEDSGFAPVDIGGSANSSLQDPGSPLWNNPMTEADARAAAQELRATGHTAADPLADAVESVAAAHGDDPAWWFERITEAVFRAGISWRVVHGKWPGFRADFHEFDPAAVAAIDHDELARIKSDSQVIRNSRKLEGTVQNARAVQALLEEYGSFGAYLRSFRDGGAAAADLARRFKFLGESGASRMLMMSARS